MSKATIVHFDKTFFCFHLFEIASSIGNTLYVQSFENGVVTIKPNPSCFIEDFATVVAGCFAEDSNFAEELKFAFGCKDDTEFKSIKFEFNGKTIVVTKENADADRITADWWSRVR